MPGKRLMSWAWKASAVLTALSQMASSPPMSNGMMVKESIGTAWSRAFWMDDPAAEEVHAGLEGRQGDEHGEAGVVLLQQLGGAELVVDRLVVLDLGLLDVQVDRLQAVAGDNLLHGSGCGGRVGADLGELGPKRTAEGDDHVAAEGAGPVDLRLDGAVLGERHGAVPRR